MNLKRLTALVALVFGLTAMGTALVAWYQELSLLRQGEAVAEAKLSGTLQKLGPTGADTTLRELARTLDWTGAYMTEIDGQSEADQKIVAASSSSLQGTTWADLQDRYSMDNLYWHGNLGHTYTGLNGKTYAVWAIMDRRNVAWPLLHQIALVTAAAAWLAITTWVSFDVTGPAQLGWTMLTLFTGPVGLTIWLIRRPIYRSAEGLICPGCGVDVPADAGFCPACGFPVQPVCPTCGHLIALDAMYCKHCGTPTTELDLAERSMPL